MGDDLSCGLASTFVLTVNSGGLQRRREGRGALSLEPGGKPVPIRTILASPGQPDLFAGDSLQALLEVSIGSAQDDDAW